MDFITKKLHKEADKDYKKFSESIMPDCKNILGVRIPVLRKLGKEIFKHYDWEVFLNKKTTCFEELILQSVIIGNIKKEPQEILKYVKNFVPKINGWGVCDNFCSNLKITKNNQKLIWKFIQPYFNSKKEYEIRFAFVMMLNYFADEKYLDKNFILIDKFKDERYYAQMAVAWALSILYIKYPNETLEYLKKSDLDKWTFNKSIQKICESSRIDKNTKNFIKTLKR